MAGITDGITTVTLGGLDWPSDMSGTLIEEITREGVAGAAFKQVGYRGRPKQAFSWATAANNSQRATAISYYKLLQGRVTTVTDDKGTAWNYVMVLDVDILRTYPIVNSPNGDLYMIEAVWTLQAVATSY